MSDLMTMYALAMLATLGVCALGAWLRPGSNEVFAAAIYVSFSSYLIQTGVAIHNAFGGGFIGPPDSYVADPAIAGFSFFLCALSWARHRAAWKGALALAYAAELWFHISYWGSRDDSTRALYYYVASVNGTHICVLLTLVAAGGRNAIAGLIELRDRARNSGVRAPVRFGQ